MITTGRRRSVRDRFRRWLSFDDDESGERADPLDKVADENAPEPSARIDGLRAMEALDAALSSLPLRQQQAFLLRAWEGMDVKQAAAAMGCTEGSVKTHYFRALQVLRARLTEHAP